MDSVCKYIGETLSFIVGLFYRESNMVKILSFWARTSVDQRSGAKVSRKVVGLSPTVSTIQTYDRGVDMKAWAHLSQGYTLRRMQIEYVIILIQFYQRIRYYFFRCCLMVCEALCRVPMSRQVSKFSRQRLARFLINHIRKFVPYNAQ